MAAAVPAGSIDVLLESVRRASSKLLAIHLAAKQLRRGVE
jgi:hypothetical protein